MKMWNTIVPMAAAVLLTSQAVAQQEEEEMHRRLKVQEAEVHEAEYSERLRDAEERMEKAARQIAELTRERLPQMMKIERRFEFSNKPMIGITIDGSEEPNPTEGVLVEGVTPGSAADAAGLHAKDIISAVNGESMSAASSQEANKLLFELMSGVEEGDVLTINYLRNGNVATVDLSPQVTESQAFAWMSDAPNVHVERIPGVPNAIREFNFAGGFPWEGNGLGSMELVELNDGLGKYFGTDTGLLVVSAPQSESFELEDGDVIQSIDGRVPKNVRQALKILGTYEAGDSVELGIMRDKKKRKLEIEIPEADHHGMRFEGQRIEPMAPAPVTPTRAPVSPTVVPPPADVST